MPLELGDCVWARMRGYSHWPGVITLPPQELLRTMQPNKHCVYFLGTRNYSWIEPENIVDYESNKEKYCKTQKSVSFKKAMNEMDAFLKVVKGKSLEQVVGDSINELLDSRGPPSEKKPRVSRKTPKKTSEKAMEDESKSDSPEEMGLPENGHNSRLLSLLNSVNVNAPMPQAPELNVLEITKTLAQKNITPSSLTFGLLGVGKIGSRILKNLVNSNHKVLIWNRSEINEDFLKAGAEHVSVPGDVVASADITFCCVPDNKVAKDLVFGNCGVLTEMQPGKGYVEMSGIDEQTSKTIAEAVMEKGGRYLEVRFKGSLKEAEEGRLQLLAAGDESLFDECSSCLDAFSVHKEFVGSVGDAANLYLCFQSMNAIYLAGLCDLLTVANCFGIEPEALIEFYKKHNLLDNFLIQKSKAILESDYTPQQTIDQLHKDVVMTIDLENKHVNASRLTRSADEYLKHAKYLGYRDNDVAAVVHSVKSCLEQNRL